MDPSIIDQTEAEHCQNKDKEPQNSFDSPGQQNIASYNHDNKENTSTSPYGPWMLVKRNPKLKPNKSQGKEGNLLDNSKGSRFQVFAEESHEEDSVQEEGVHPSLDSARKDQKIQRVRDPKAGKNTQQHKSNSNKNSNQADKGLKDKGKISQQKVKVSNSKEVVVPSQSTMPLTKLPNRK
ncbi:hypothetical protein SESBI_08103 [Sesbania bispinosa]|nr:hypothetical protein SESBI_08103 [Sesbania bispinosa]